MQKLVKAIDQMNKVILVILSLMLGVMSVVIIFQVFSRYVFNLPLPWSEELARYLMVYSIFIGAALALRQGRLIAVEAVAEKLSPKNRRRFKSFALLVSIVFFIVLFTKGLEILGQVGAQKSPALQIPMSIPYAAISIGAVLLIINAIAVLIEMNTNPDADTESENAIQEGDY